MGVFVVHFERSSIGTYTSTEQLIPTNISK
jgi:hypothetical protein